MKDVSPKKMGGFCIGHCRRSDNRGAVAAAVARARREQRHHACAALVIGLIGSIVGTLGDLSISMVNATSTPRTKQPHPRTRRFLDRLDSIIVTGLLSYYYLRLVLF